MAGDVFPFFMFHQEQSHWCWAATAVSVSHFYDVASPSMQCLVVDDEFGSTNCCDNGSTDACNRDGSAYNALKRVGHSGMVEFGTASILENEIAARRPVVTRIDWTGGAAHFLLINGYGDIVVSLTPFVQERYLQIQDPWYGPSFIPYNSFRMAYQGTGKWTYTLYTT